jgi:class 3 adenylate cyclase
MGQIIQPPTGIVTLMFTNIVGSTMLRDTLIATHGEGEGNRLYRKRILEPQNQRIGELLAKHDGFEVKTNGDSFMVAFARPEDAVMCAAAIQRSLRAEPIRTGDPAQALAVRIGMHTGEAKYVERDGKPDYDGHAVNIAARVESLLKGGERIYCSGETKVLAKTAPGIRFHSYGPYTLKGVSARIEIFDILWDDALHPAPQGAAARHSPLSVADAVGRPRARDDRAGGSIAREQAGDAPRHGWRR